MKRVNKVLNIIEHWRQGDAITRTIVRAVCNVERPRLSVKTPAMLLATFRLSACQTCFICDCVTPCLATHIPHLYACAACYYANKPDKNIIYDIMSCRHAAYEIKSYYVSYKSDIMVYLLCGELGLIYDVIAHIFRFIIAAQIES